MTTSAAALSRALARISRAGGPTRTIRRDGRQSRYALSFRFTECLELRLGIGLQSCGTGQAGGGLRQQRIDRVHGDDAGTLSGSQAEPEPQRASGVLREVDCANDGRIERQENLRSEDATPRLPYSREDTSASAKPS